jgi:hypothetical protein
MKLFSSKKAELSVAAALLLVLCIDGILFAGQSAIHDISVEMGTGANLTFLNYHDSFISSFDAGNYTVSTNNSAGGLPDANPSVSADTGDIFTDTFTSIKNWFTDAVSGIGKGIRIFFGILGGPYTYVSAMNLPSWFAYMIGAIWYGLTFFLIVAFITGRQ